MATAQTAGKTATIRLIPNTRENLPRGYGDYKPHHAPYHDISYYQMQYSGKSSYTPNELWAATIDMRHDGVLHPWDLIVQAEYGIALIEHSYPIGD